MATLKVNEITPTSGTSVTIGGNLLCGSGSITTTGNASCGQLTTAGSVAIGGNVDMESNGLTEVGGLSASATVTTGEITGFGAINVTNATLTGTLTMDGTDDIVMTASDGKIACKILEVDGAVVSASSQPLKCFGRVAVNTQNTESTQTAVLETGSLNVASVSIASEVVTITFTNALAGTTYIVPTTVSIPIAYANPGTRGTSSVEINVSDDRTFDFDFMVLSL
tara:strand:- start:1945 stop:2616 length:672 start_codon:yes stop_codon:yes gene_type:complete